MAWTKSQVRPATVVVSIFHPPEIIKSGGRPHTYGGNVQRHLVVLGRTSGEPLERIRPGLTSRNVFTVQLNPVTVAQVLRLLESAVDDGTGVETHVVVENCGIEASEVLVGYQVALL